MFASVELLKKGISVRLRKLDASTATTYRGTLNESLCERANDDDPLGLSGSLTALGTTPAPISVTLRRNSYLDIDRARFRLEGSHDGSDETVLDLWNTLDPGPPSKLSQAVALILNEPVDLEAAVETPQGTLVVATLALGTRTLSLAELSKEPRRLLHRTETGLTCELQSCNAGLAGFEFAEGELLLVPSVFGENCGAKCTNSATAELWALTSTGFHSGLQLPESIITPSGIDYTGTVTSNALYWVDGDGKSPLEILVESTERADGEETSTRFVVGYDHQAHTYTKREGLIYVTAEQLDSFRGQEFVSY